ncbi:DUF7537 family lipoprotein [Halorarius litoreus]|uniref:DUF7537 family lipoprotein n=1 Tax=Halorarius litoreus TaxID=2962676 RepID=UPI0020CC555B|nr:hypothetical protein [Halorarius litoreus]
MQRQLPVILLIALLVLSGCSFLGGPASPTPTDAGSVTSSPTPGAGSTPTTTTRTPAPYPPGYGESGVVDADRAVQAHTQGVLDRESFIVEFNGTALTNESLASISALQTANLSTERAYVITHVEGRGTTTQFYENGTVYVRTDPPGENNTRYRSQQGAFEPRSFTGVDQVEPLIRNVEYGPPERVRRSDGGAFFRYRASGVENVSDIEPILGQGVDPANVTEFEVGIVVGPDGIVHRSAYRATIRRGDDTLKLAIEVNVLGFESTAVDRPDWLDEAS